MILTQKDKQDIFSYYGCMFRFITGASYDHGPMKLDADSAKYVEQDDLIELKLLLRPTSSITKEEMHTMKSLCGIKYGGYLENDFGLWQYYHPKDYITGYGGDYKPCLFQASINSYLQSIGVYVPYSINRDFVEFI